MSLARENEREAVAAFMRQQAEILVTVQKTALNAVADAIERCDHLQQILPANTPPDNETRFSASGVPKIANRAPRGSERKDHLKTQED